MTGWQQPETTRDTLPVALGVWTSQLVGWRGPGGRLWTYPEMPTGDEERPRPPLWTPTQSAPGGCALRESPGEVTLWPRPAATIQGVGTEHAGGQAIQPQPWAWAGGGGRPQSCPRVSPRLHSAHRRPQVTAQDTLSYKTQSSSCWARFSPRLVGSPREPMGEGAPRGRDHMEMGSGLLGCGPCPCRACSEPGPVRAPSKATVWFYVW